VAKRIKVVRAVLDTNIFLRALIREGNICHKITELWKDDHFILITSREILNEIKGIHSIFYGNPWSALPLCTANCAIHKGIVLPSFIEWIRMKLVMIRANGVL